MNGWPWSFRRWWVGALETIFFPFASGVMFSRNVYAWNPKIKKEEGLVRLVFGLGTRAVDRVGSDYPRMIPLSHPQLRPEMTADRIQEVLPEAGRCPQSERRE